MIALEASYADLVEHLAQHFHTRDLRLDSALQWLTAELGEAMEVRLLMQGLNPRKGFQGDMEDLAAELADVVIMALIAMRMTGCDVQDTLSKHVAKMLGRLEEQGNAYV